ncbi:MAG: tetratricopeptide repeat protein [Deltaproteobacteria bacterium]|nr:tetratricopeptide repeat protein [Deltaproteobacteria bacterium]
MRRSALALLVVLIASAISAPARAEKAEPAGDAAPEPKKTPNQLKAEAHYKRARELYQLGRYREAIAQLEAALKLDPGGAELLYNLGLVHEKLGDVDEAVDAYKRYLKALGPDADPEEVAKIKGIMKRLEGAKTELKAREAKKTEHRFTPLSAGLLVGAGVAALATGVFGIAALRHDSEAREFVVRDEKGVADRQVLVDRAGSEATMANVFGALTVLSAATGVTLYLLSEYPKEDDPTEVPRAKAALRMVPLPRGGAVGLEVVF